MRTFSKLARVRAAAVAGALCLSLAGCADEVSSNGAEQAPGAAGGDTVKIMVGGLDKVIYLPAVLTQRLGHFREQGVSVQLLTEQAGVQATTSLVAGDVQGVVGFYDHTLGLQVKGKRVESVVQLAQTPGEVEVVSKKAASRIASPKDFKGRKLGVTGLGSSTDFLTKYLAVKNGVKVSEFTPVAVGAGQTFISALQQGAIDGGMTTDPTVAQVLAKDLGTVLVDMRTPEGSRAALGGLYPASSLYMNTDWVNSHKDVVQKLANAFVKTLKWMSEHTPEEIAAKMPADYAKGGKELYAQAVKSTLPMFTKDGVMPADGPRTVLEVLRSFHPDLKNGEVDLAKTYTTEFVRKAGLVRKAG
ncbi:ABC transporter substrate-binding protein [Streptomyces sp. NPDC046215]|uniref:ABC transporter substrate-binding protein n=1 Tax=Streptomyces stramineus TaxID=173861 RepID=A0ABP3KZ41_9ACTN